MARWNKRRPGGSSGFFRRRCGNAKAVTESERGRLSIVLPTYNELDNVDGSSIKLLPLRPVHPRDPVLLMMIQPMATANRRQGAAP